MTNVGTTASLIKITHVMFSGKLRCVYCFYEIEIQHWITITSTIKQCADKQRDIQSVYIKPKVNICQVTWHNMPSTPQSEPPSSMFTQASQKPYFLFTQ
jgi:hypothetical protein